MTTTLLARRAVSVGVPDVEGLALEAGVHPELVRRLVALGFLDPPTLDAAPRIARAVRLRRDLGLNYAGALLAGELLDRIEQLELRLRRYEAADRLRR
jgi:hypothetical protein